MPVCVPRQSFQNNGNRELELWYSAPAANQSHLCVNTWAIFALIHMRTERVQFHSDGIRGGTEYCGDSITAFEGGERGEYCWDRTRRTSSTRLEAFITCVRLPPGLCAIDWWLSEDGKVLHERQRARISSITCEGIQLSHNFARWITSIGRLMQLR